MSTPHRIPSSGSSASVPGPRTIDEIEARAAEVLEAERDGMRRLAEFLRELAVELPPESGLPLKLAKAAKTIELFERGSHPGIGTMDLFEVIEEWGVEACAELAAKLRAAGILRGA